MHVDPILPPVNRARVITELVFLLRHQSVGQLFHVVGNEIMLVMKNKWLEEPNQLFHFFQAALSPSQRLSQLQRSHDPLD